MSLLDCTAAAVQRSKQNCLSSRPQLCWLEISGCHAEIVWWGLKDFRNVLTDFVRRLVEKFIFFSSEQEMPCASSEANLLYTSSFDNKAALTSSYQLFIS